jgi:hypothetical protein
MRYDIFRHGWRVQIAIFYFATWLCHVDSTWLKMPSQHPLPRFTSTSTGTFKKYLQTRRLNTPLNSNQYSTVVVWSAVIRQACLSGCRLDRNTRPHATRRITSTGSLIDFIGDKIQINILSHSMPIYQSFSSSPQSL